MDNARSANETAAPYDYRQHDRVWQRVAPSLEPYPAGQTAAELGRMPGDAAGPPWTAAGQAALEQTAAGVPVPRQSAQTAAEEQLPGAAADPCCMGSAAQEMIEVIQGFIEDELADRRYYRAFLRQAPAQARQTLRDIAGDKERRARELMAVYYLITGRCYRPAVSWDRVYIGGYCPALRERYHVEACAALNYARAAEGTTDPCLRRVLQGLAAENDLHAAALTDLLEQALPGPCGPR